MASSSWVAAAAVCVCLMVCATVVADEAPRIGSSRTLVVLDDPVLQSSHSAFLQTLRGESLSCPCCTVQVRVAAVQHTEPVSRVCLCVQPPGGARVRVACGVPPSQTAAMCSTCG